MKLHRVRPKPGKHKVLVRKPARKQSDDAPKINLKGGGTTKVPISIRLDEVIISHFKDRHPTGYQSAINDVLLKYVSQNS